MAPRKPYMAAYSEKGLEEINHAIDSDATARVVQAVAKKYDPLDPVNKPSLAHVRQYMSWYRDQKRLAQERGQVFKNSSEELSGVQSAIQKVKDGQRLGKADINKAYAEFLGKLRSRIELMEVANAEEPDIDRETLIGKHIRESMEILQSLAKIEGLTHSDGGINLTQTNISLAVEDVFHEVLEVVNRALLLVAPERAEEIRQAILQEFDRNSRRVPAIEAVEAEIVKAPEKEGDDVDPTV